MSFDSTERLLKDKKEKKEQLIEAWNKDFSGDGEKWSTFHGDGLIGDKARPDGTIAGILNTAGDIRRLLTFDNLGDIATVAGKKLTGGGLDLESGSKLVAALSNDSNLRASFIESQVKDKYDKMLHPPLSYLGDAFKYRTPDGKFNSAMHPHLGQGGAPYAKTVPSKTHPLGALPDPSDVFDRLMARDGPTRESKSGLSSMLIYHATIIIHDIFRTNASDKNISDSSSYLDLSPLYGFTEGMQRSVRDDKYKLGLLKPDCFAEDRLLRQPPGVCIMLVMYNRYHNYAATQLRRINENNKFSVPNKFQGTKLSAAVTAFASPAHDATEAEKKKFKDLLSRYDDAWKDWVALDSPEEHPAFHDLENELNNKLQAAGYLTPGDNAEAKALEAFNLGWKAAWDKLDDDLFNTARLITCGIYIQVSIHDYLRALMGFHQYNTNFTLDPRVDMKDHKNVSRGLGNQVTVEFNLLYRFHCAITANDEAYTEEYLRRKAVDAEIKDFDPKNMTMEQFLKIAKTPESPTEPKDQEFGLKKSKGQEGGLEEDKDHFKRDKITRLFSDQQMIDALTKAMDTPIGNFGPQNVPKCMKPVELMGIIQARKWEVGTLNDFRDFFGMKRHKTFGDISADPDVEEALRDLYEHPDKVELYPGIFCESDGDKNADPGPSEKEFALWAAIFSDAITLVRSDRFYTVDWNTNSLTTWGMKEVTPDNNVLKSSVFHRLYQRAFPEWFPADSIRFFHPFYTSTKNAEYAQKQELAKGFKINLSADEQIKVKRTDPEYDCTPGDPKKPVKPLVLDEIWQIKAILFDDSDLLVHPARLLALPYLPKAVADILKPGQKNINESKDAKKNDRVQVDPSILRNHFEGLMRNILIRNAINMTPKKGENEQKIWQIDVVKDFAIPVVTRYVADFLGFADSIRSESNPNGKYSENYIYQHITNCQTFLAYNVDETKFLKRREAFSKSMEFLFKLTEGGNILEANKWGITRSITSLWREDKSPVKELGFKVAEEILKTESDSGKAAAILLLIGLDNAYNSVLAFASVLNSFFQGLDNLSMRQAKGWAKDDETCAWLQVQALAFNDDPTSFDEIEKLVLKAQRDSVKHPIIRKARKQREFTDESDQSRKFTVAKNQTVICDIYNAGRPKTGATNGTTHKEDDDADLLAYCSSFTEMFVNYHPKELARCSLTVMVRVLARMKDLRRGHDTQGKFRRVNIDAQYEGYSNYMAPMRMREISLKVKHGLEVLEKNKPKSTDGTDALKKYMKEKERLEEIFKAEKLKPATYTYLTPEWDEMIPFPTTWKLRFDGCGESTYGNPRFSYLTPKTVYDTEPPWYQPTGPSHTGGSFGDPSAKVPKSSGELPASAGCGMSSIAPVIPSAPLTNGHI
ncbi:hypothetical protein G7Z17_g9144 [Cylindrodendrum hubeiense]|uniref:Uncharacterized protein n=1 Tax=Cylindrodendrum hubeiense TaxID=595255 RepID=A0A9P5LDM3_9HYPO|nr:hypothetical protein G7Z17_g9144 [Cylindrodendrum hubeiense]